MQGIVPLVRAKNVQPGYFDFTLEAPWIAESAEPGQFIHIRFPSGYHPLLRRPFSVYDTDGKKKISFLFRVEGEGTRLLSLCNEGDELDVLGPRGRGFHISDLADDDTVILVGGGVGIPPMAFLSKMLRDRGREHAVFIGVRGKEHVVAVDRLEKAGQEVVLTSDDGSVGKPGLVTDALGERLEELGDRRVRLFACGPTPMLQAVMTISHWHANVAAQVSLEERMSCAIGACMGCVVRTVRGYERVCTEGPVFNAEDIEPDAWIGP